MIKVEIEVDQILTSAVSLEIEPGDRLLVMNGVIIGLVEKRAVKPTAQPKRLDAAMPSDLRAAVLSELRSYGPLSAFTLGKRLGLDKTGRRSLALVLGELRRHKVIEPNDTSRYPAYRLVKPLSD